MRISQENEDQRRQKDHQPAPTPGPQETCRLRLKFPKSARLLKKAQFQAVIRYGKRFVGSELVIDWRKSNGPSAKLGLSVSKRFGKAHDRNRFKRLIREVFRERLPTFPPGLEINVIPRSSHSSLKKEVLAADLNHFLAHNEKKF